MGVYLWDKNYCKKEVKLIPKSGAIHTLRVVDNQIICGGYDKKLYILNADCETVATHDCPDVPRAVDKQGDKIIVGCLNGDIV